MADTPAWKEDFPISWGDDSYVTRRGFTKSLVLVSCAMSCANGALVAREALERRAAPASLAPMRIGSVQGLPIGGSRVFEYGGEPCLLIRLDADRTAAYGQKCTHLGCPVLYRKETKKLHCPCHEGYFNAEDGKVLAGPPPRPLPRVTLERRGDDLWATGMQA